MKIKNFALLIVSLAVFSPAIIFGEANSNLLQSVNCFDYYHFGNVGVNISLEKESTLGRPADPSSLPPAVLNKSYVFGGTDAKFSGKVTNPESYPIVDGSVYVKIFKKINPTGKSSTAISENALVDQFYATKGISIGAKKQSQFYFSWKVPERLESGDYYIAAYFIVGDKFNVSGLFSTDSVTGGTTDFSILASKDGAVSFDKTSVKVGNQKYSFGADYPRVDDGNPIKITFSLDNKTASPQRIPVSYILYKSDNLKTENILNTTSELVILGAKSSKNLSYTINDGQHAVYYLVAEADNKGAKSIIDIRVIRNNINKLELSYAAIGAYPFVADTLSSVMACAVNTSFTTVENAKLVLSVIDNRGKTIWSGNYEGVINGAMTGLSGAFKAEKDLSDFWVKAELYDGKDLADQVILPYSCKAIDPKLCASGLLDQVWFIPTIVILAIALAIFVMIEKRKNKISENLNP